MVNCLVMQGRFVADPELKDTNSGVKVANFKIAWSKKIKDRETKCFLECKAFDKQAEHVCKYFRKGQETVVTGELQTEEWEKDGQKRSKIVLVIGTVHFCGKKEDNPGGESVVPNMTPVNVPDDQLPF